MKIISIYIDQLGNVRVSYGRNSAGALEITDANDYYPFGMNHLKTGNAYFAQGSYKSNKYNGKELQETGMYSYGWREYMPDIGRWNGIDQLAENYLSASPYAYVLNNPISLFDPDGRVTMAAITQTMMDATPDGSNSYWYSNTSGGFTSYDGGDKGGHAGGGTLAYGSTVSSGGMFTLGDGTYTLPPLVLSAPKSYQGNSALTGLTLSFGIDKHLATYIGRQVEGFDQMAWTRNDGGVKMIGGYGDPFGFLDIGGAYIENNLSQDDQETFFAATLLAAVIFKKPGLAKLDANIAEKEMTTIYRSVSPAELSDIAQNGLRSGTGYETGKLFTTTAKDASFFSKNMGWKWDGTANTIIKVQVPKSVMTQATFFEADGIKSVSIPANLFQDIRLITPLNYSPIP